MAREEIEQKLNAFLIETLEIDPALVKPENSLKNDVGLTSLDVVDIRLFVQKNFGWQMGREDILSIVTLSDLFFAIEGHTAL